MARIERELEIDRFMRTQIQTRIVIKALFSRLERYLIRNNRRFVLESGCKNSKILADDSKQNP